MRYNKECLGGSSARACLEGTAEAWSFRARGPALGRVGCISRDLLPAHCWVLLFLVYGLSEELEINSVSFQFSLNISKLRITPINPIEEA